MKLNKQKDIKNKISINNKQVRRAMLVIQRRF